VGILSVRNFDGSYYLRKRILADVESDPSYPAWEAFVSHEDKASQHAVDLRMQRVCVSMKSDNTRRENIYSKCAVSDLNPFR
jgi:hypothetical protein